MFVDHVYSIKIQNNSNDTIQFYASYNYPDTLVSKTKPSLTMAYPTSFSYLDSERKWKDVLPKDTILIYILNKDTVDFYSWNIIMSKNNIQKRFTLSVNDLESLKSTVTYP